MTKNILDTSYYNPESGYSSFTYKQILNNIIRQCSFDTVAQYLLDLEHDRYVEEDTYCVHGNIKNHCNICNNFVDDMA